MKIDSRDLVDANEVAELLGLSHRQAVSVYRRRYEDLPSPVVEQSRCVLWLCQDVEQWAKARRP